MLNPGIQPDANIPIGQITRGPVTKVYTSGNYTYICKSSLGGLETDPCWSIQRVESTDTTTITLWACGIANEVFKASLRESYTYK